MHAPPFPIDEAERCRTLRSLQVLDTLPESFSDAIASAAAAIANAPISALSLVDAERQWFKASCGLEATGSTRDVSFCGHAVLGVAPLLVPDAHADARFRDNPFVTGAPFVRSYAGFPLVVDGQAVGALCVMDDQPRSYPLGTLDRLQALADAASSWLGERRRSGAMLAHTRRQLTHAGLTDTFTGLPNRLVFQDRLEQAIARCDRTNACLAALLVDIGPGPGATPGWDDAPSAAFMREMAGRLRRLVRTSDTVGRIGDRHFGVLLESVRRPDDLSRLATDLCASLDAPFETAATPSATDPSATSASGTPSRAAIGIALYPLNGPAAQLMSRAGTALALARSAGSAFRFFEARVDAQAHAKAALLAALRVATEERQFALHYQPKLRARDGVLAGVEALIRWQHPVHGQVGPAVFIPLAEDAGLISAIGSWVIREALRQMRQWADAGTTLRVAINLSLHQLRRDSFATEVESAARAAGVDPSLLTFEITESVAMQDADVAAEVLERLKALGVRVSIDDFGTGFSSLSYLRRLAVHQLKIDRSFVTDLSHDEDAKALVKGIIDLAHALRLEVVAEGVETTAQRDELLRLGCDKLQGYLFARPMAAAALCAWHRQARRESWPRVDHAGAAGSSSPAQPSATPTASAAPATTELAGPAEPATPRRRLDLRTRMRVRRGRRASARHGPAT